jgi:hypothetical protein
MLLASQATSADKNFERKLEDLEFKTTSLQIICVETELGMLD